MNRGLTDRPPEGVKESSPNPIQGHDLRVSMRQRTPAHDGNRSTPSSCRPAKQAHALLNPNSPTHPPAPHQEQRHPPPAQKAVAAHCNPHMLITLGTGPRVPAAQWDDRDSAPRKMKPLGLDVVCFDDFAAAPQLFTEKGFGSFASPWLIGLWRHSYGVERKFVKLIHTQERAGHEGAKAAKTNQQRHLLRPGPGGVAGAALRGVRGPPQADPGLRARDRRERVRPTRGRE